MAASPAKKLFLVSAKSLSSLNSTSASLLGLFVVALVCLPRKWAFLPLVAGGTYLGFGQGIELGSFSFTTLRILVVAGGLRVIIYRERLPGGLIGLDRLMVVWALWTCVSSAFHADPRSDLITKFGTVGNACGIYFLLRIFCVSFKDVVRLCGASAIILLPVAMGMLCEQLFLYNPFSILGSVPEAPMIRDGRIRAFGTYTHPILAGTVGAVTFPLMAGLWRYHRMTAWFGGIVCLLMVVVSGSSGPVMSVVAAVVALSLWRYRKWMRTLRWAAVAIYIVLNIVMKVPAYYIIARLDVTGSSTGYHRAALIESSLKHLNEWWFAGTDYTRHWMPTGVSWNPNHTDITNHYLQMGVIGGLPSMALFIATLALGFAYVGKGARRVRRAGVRKQFVLWGFGSALFAQAVTCISVSYFDQSVLFLYMTLAVIGSSCKQPIQVYSTALRSGSSHLPDPVTQP